jgi:hypothetical protein
MTNSLFTLQSTPACEDTPATDLFELLRTSSPPAISPPLLALLAQHLSRGAIGCTGGGGERDRTDDLLLAKQALSQLSYTPFQKTDARNQKRRISAVLISAFLSSDGGPGRI